jgi:hypothetical protein
LQSLNRGESCVFKLENEDVWAVGWSDVHYKTYITTHGLSNDGEPAQKKRQRLDERNYRIEINRPKVIATYQNHMGWVDRHNRFRQDILGLHVIWKTKRWQTRVQIEIFGMTLVDAFLLAPNSFQSGGTSTIWSPLSSASCASCFPPLRTAMRTWRLAECAPNVLKF